MLSVLLAGAWAMAAASDGPSLLISSDVPLLIDSSVARDVNDVAAQAAEFQLRTLGELGPFPAPVAIWAKLDLPASGRAWQLLLEGDSYQFGTLYVRSEPAGYRPIYGKEIASADDDDRRRSVFSLPDPSVHSGPLYLRVVAQGWPQLALTLWDKRAFGADAAAGGSVDPTFGLLLVVAIAALITGLLWRQWVLLELSALAGVLLVILLYVNGAAYRSETLAWLGFNTQAQAALIALALLLAWRYTLSWITARGSQPLLRLAGAAVHIVLPGLALAALALDAVRAPWVAQATAIAGYLTTIAAFAVAVGAAIGRQRVAAFLALAWAWFGVFFGLQQLGAFRDSFFAGHGLHLAVGGAVILVVIGYIDRAMGARVRIASQVREQQRDGALLRVERSRRDFADSVAELLRTLDPSLYEEHILQRFLEHLSGMVPFAAGAVAVSHRGDVRLCVHGQANALDTFETILATREQLLQSVCLSDRAAVIHSDDLGVNPAGEGASCLGIVPIKADRNEWAGVLLARTGELEFGIDELALVGDFAHQAYAALLNAQQFGKVRRQAEIDALTGIFNRRALLARGARSYRKARSLRLSLSVLFVDIDHFKKINDDCGHAVGDRALQRVAHLCSESLRDDDFLGRYGGEEFLAVLPGATASDAEQVAERLRQAVEKHVIAVDDVSLKLTVSVGIAEMSAGVESFDDLLRAADRALYKAKRDGRNRIVHHRYERRGDRLTRPLG